MTESIGSNFQNIGHVTTTKWKEKPQGENNDCYWNIAQNSLDAGASNEEIARVMNELIELNAQKDENGNYNTVLYADKEVLMPVEQTIEQADKVIGETFKSYQEALNEYNNTINSLEDTDESKQALENAKENIKKEQEKLSELKTSLSNLQNEYKEAGTDSEKLADYQAMLDSIDEQTETKRLEAENLSVKEQEASQALKKEAELAVKDTNAVQSSSESQNQGEIKTDKETQDVNNAEQQQEAQTDNEMLKEQLVYISSEWQKAQNEQGIFGKMANGVKNLFNTEYSSKKVNSEVEALMNKYQNGEEISPDEIVNAYEKIETYRAKQDSTVDKTTTFGAILTGSLAGAKAGAAGGAALGSVVPGAGTAAGAVVGGICGFIGGAFAGAFAKTGLKQLENVTDDVKGNSFKLDDMKQDAISGAKSGGFSGATAGISSGVKAFKEAKAFALSEPEVIHPDAVVDKDGNVIASLKDNEAGLATQQASQGTAQTAQQALPDNLANPANVADIQNIADASPISATAQNHSANSIANGTLNSGDSAPIILNDQQAVSTSGVFENKITNVNIPNEAIQTNASYTIDYDPISPISGEALQNPEIIDFNIKKASGGAF